MPRTFRLAVLSVALAAAACKGGEDSQAAADSALARDLTLAGQTAAEPSLSDVPESLSAPAATPTPNTPPRPAPQRVGQRTAPRTAPAPAPVAEAPRAPSPAAAPATGSIAAGSVITVVTSARVCTKSNLPGDKLTALVRGATPGSNGVTLPEGSTAVLEVASIGSGETADATSIGFRVRAVSIGGVSHTASGEAVANEQLEKVAVGNTGGTDKKKVIGGAIAGAVLGQVLGKDAKSTVIGAAAGAAAGTVAAKASRKYEGCLPAGTTVRLTLTEPLVLPIS